MAPIASQLDRPWRWRVVSWMTGINSNVEGRQVRRVMRYSGGHPAFRQHCDAVSGDGYRDLSMA